MVLVPQTLKTELKELYLNDRFYKDLVTIQSFIIQDDIDLNPIHQRPDVGDINKKRGIVEHVLIGLNIGEITLNDAGEDYQGKYRYESLDGGHRKRAIKEFVAGKFSLSDGRFFKDLTKNERNKFLSTYITFVYYKDLRNEEKGMVFRALNKTTTMTKQEIRNAYGDTPLANYVRNFVRVTPHEIWDYVAFDNDRLKIEELVARIVTMTLGKLPLETPACDKSLDKLYANDNISLRDMEKVHKKILAVYNFIIEMAKARNLKYASKSTNTTRTKVGKGEFSLWLRIYFHCAETYGEKFIVVDYDKLWVKVNSIYQNVTQNVADLDERFLNPYDGLPVLDETKTPAQQFKSVLGEWKSAKVLRYAIQMLIAEGLDFSKYVSEGKRTGRTFSETQMQSMLAIQEFECGVDNEDLVYADAEGGHKTSAKNNGSTDTSNLVMIRAKWNQDMSDMNYDDYMILWNKANKGKDEYVYVNKLVGKNK
jgi:hypothetical protein